MSSVLAIIGSAFLAIPSSVIVVRTVLNSCRRHNRRPSALSDCKGGRTRHVRCRAQAMRGTWQRTKPSPNIRRVCACCTQCALADAARGCSEGARRRSEGGPRRKATQTYGHGRSRNRSVKQNERLLSLLPRIHRRARARHSPEVASRGDDGVRRLESRSRRQQRNVR
jgi:hypothetical protein